MIVSLISIFLYIPIISQNNMKYTYIPEKHYNDPDIHKIIFNNEVASIYNLAGEIKSIRTIKYDSFGTKYERKFFFNKEKKTERIIEYDKDNKVKLDKTYYSRGNYLVPFVSKDGFDDYGKTKFFSELDTINKMITSKKTIDDKLITLDTIYYEGNFKPIIIKSYSNKNELISTQIVDYNRANNKIELSLKISNFGYASGTKFFYDENHRFLYSKSIRKADINPLKYEIEDPKIDYFIWESHGFTYYSTASSDTVTYNYKTRILKRKSRGGSEKITKLTVDYKPLYIEYHFLNAGSLFISYDYNSYWDLKSLDYQSKDKSQDDRDEYFEYMYDNYNNWIKRKKYCKGELIETYERIIEYY